MDANDHSSVDGLLDKLEMMLGGPDPNAVNRLARFGQTKLIDKNQAWHSIDRINRVIAMMDVATACASVNHPSRVVALNTWADALLRRFTMTRSVEDVDTAISKYEEALESCYNDVQSCAASLASLGDALLSRYEWDRLTRGPSSSDHDTGGGSSIDTCRPSCIRGISEQVGDYID